MQLVEDKHIVLSYAMAKMSDGDLADSNMNEVMRL